jgi:alpha-glucosidase
MGAPVIKRARQKSKRGLQTMTTLRILSMAILISLTVTSCKQPQTADVYSPDGNIRVDFTIDEGGPVYSVSFEDKQIIRPSGMGFSLKNTKSMHGGFAISKIKKRNFKETWKPVWGESSEIENHYNELAVYLVEVKQPNRRMNIIFRAFDDGVGFRYELPEQEHLTDIEIESERTYFNFTDNHTCWWIPANWDSYEQTYTQSPLNDVSDVNTPFTIRTSDGICISIHEANLTDYAGMTLTGNRDIDYMFRSKLVPWPDGVKVKASTPMVTPWRTIQLSDRAGGLIESNLILNLNEPCVIEDTSWIKPMKYIGIWWGMHIKKYTWYIGPQHGATTEIAKEYIDFASAHNIPGLLIEGWNTGWENWGKKDAFDFVTPYADFDIEEITRYARERNVVIIGHHETGGDVPRYEEMIDSAFAMYNRLGIPAVKTGYAGGIFPRGQHHHGQWMVNHYRSVVKKAAEHRIMLDVHEPIKPTGIRRTWPNMMTREGVRGMEYNAWSEGNPPEHTTILPFTRMLAGPADYTPGIFDLTFDEYRPENRVYSTLANQLALYVVLYSPLQMAADLPENYEDHPAFEFIEAVPVDWDETIALNCAIGDYVTIARRHGDEWYIGSVTDENMRVLSADLSFLDTGRRYNARIYADTPYTNWEHNPTLIDITNMVVDQSTTLTIKLAPGGGQAIRLRPVTR